MQYNLLSRFRDRNKCEITAKNLLLIMKTINCNCTYLHSSTYTHYIQTHICIVTYTTQSIFCIQHPAKETKAAIENTSAKHERIG